MVEWTTLAPIVATILSLVVTGIAVGWWKHEQRLRAVESGQSRQSRSIYGDDDNPRHDGIADDIDKLEQQVANAKEAVKETEDTIEDIEDYLDEINGYREKYK